MSHSPEGQSTPATPPLPVELVDEIIADALRTLDPSGVSSIALASHALRIHANRARFTSLVLYRKDSPDVQHTAKSIRTLADIIRNGHSIPTMPGICEFTTSFALKMIGLGHGVMPALEDGCLAYIFNNLFRPSGVDTSIVRPGTSAGTRSLFLNIYRETQWRILRVHDDSKHGRLIWDKINPELLAALEDLIQFSTLNRLSLEHMRNIPTDLLQGTKIKHLRLSMITISPPLSHHRLDRPPLERSMLLESFDVHDADLQVDVMQMKILGSDIRVSLRIPYNFWLYGCGVDTNGMRCTLKDTDIKRVHLYTIKCNHLIHLKSISLWCTGYRPHALVVHLLRHDIPPSVKDLSVTIVPDSENPGSEAGSDVSPLQHKDDVDNFDKHLIRPSFDSIRRIAIGVEIDLSNATTQTSDTLPNLFETWRAYIKNQIPLLSEKVGDRLEVFARLKDQTMQ
ncbi:hypothetical protein CVT25_002178 [Psilocybe cyanescens]|uniref:F-box domain-containing protein n=1 Tax=Psilocybe cyanescens TaxID=93625 RepID=A0A409X023_PSICY|nr:hypothetical protein CVT25_002178 [Psilocybe cyanescens]